MALTVPTPPTPPTPPTIERGDAAESHAKIDAHKFFQIPFERKEKLAIQAETPAQPPVVEQKKSPAPEDLAREAVANGAGALTKKIVTRPADEEIPRQTTAAPQRDGKAVLREFQNEDVQATVETPRNFSYSQRESHGGIFWAVALILVGVASFVFAKKFLLKKTPAPKIDKPKVPAPKKPVKSKHFEIRV